MSDIFILYSMCFLILIVINFIQLVNLLKLIKKG